MTDYYNILGVSESASPDEIKKAYRKLANQHHPDKGGDQAKFKDISVANDILSDPQKRAEYDQQRQFGSNPQFKFNSNDFSHFQDIFGGGGFDPFGHRSNPFSDMFGRRMQRNRDLNIQCQVTLLESFQGKQLEANYRLPSGKAQTVVISVPEGISHGETIRYAGLGDDTITQMPRGNLNVTIVVLPDSDFRREGNDLYTSIDVNPIEAMVGCRKQIKKITGEPMMLEIRPGVESGTEYAQGGAGFPNVHNRGIRGRFVIVVNIKTPAITDPKLVADLQRINDEISNRG